MSLKNVKHFLTKWRIKYSDIKTGKERVINANVPGDINDDLFRAGIIPDPYFGMNHKKIEWVIKNNFTYESFFSATDTQDFDEIYLNFDSIDLFSEIYLNDILLGKTENMFLQYRFEIKSILKPINKLVVKMFSTKNIAEKQDYNKYFGIFNSQRVLLRKKQCDFGWDWCPDMSGYGICGDVYLTFESKYKIDHVSYISDIDGNVTFISELNYTLRNFVDYDGNLIENKDFVKDNDRLVFKIEDYPESGTFIVKEIEVIGKKSLININVKNPQLWWPVGYGKQNLYKYVVQLKRGDCIVSEKCGNFAFRTVRILQRPKTDRILGFEFLINEKKIFVNGSNWVPMECFTGLNSYAKYERLIELAVNGRFNMLRVWGGGLYEKDEFYDLCDKYGVMVWQDLMFSCADFPEDNKKWTDNCIKEFKYQIKRLCNHPSIVYWSGGNERTGSLVYQKGIGNDFVRIVLPGVLSYLDSTRPFGYQSPCSLIDIDNDNSSGDCHAGSCEGIFETLLNSDKTDLENYRKRIADSCIGFMSECAVLGPNSIETDKKVYPTNSLWPLNEFWDDRMTTNPYAFVKIPFVKRMSYIIKDMYGNDADSLESFTKMGMQAQAEMLRAEYEYSRSTGITSGFMNWMYNEMWPAGTWALIDYYLEPKQAYYQMKRSFVPLLVSFTQKNDGRTYLFASNISFERKQFEVHYGVKDNNCNLIFEKTIDICVEADGVFSIPVEFDAKDFSGAYYFAEYLYGEKKQKFLYSKDFWANNTFGNDFDYIIKKISDNQIEITIKANSFIKSLFISFKDNYKYIFSDNYLDIESGCEETVTVFSKQNIDCNLLSFSPFINKKEG